MAVLSADTTADVEQHQVDAWRRFSSVERLRHTGAHQVRAHLLRGIDAESGELSEALHLVMVSREQIGHLLIELAEVILDHAQFFQRALQQPTVNRMQ